MEGWGAASAPAHIVLVIYLSSPLSLARFRIPTGAGSAIYNQHVRGGHIPHGNGRHTHYNGHIPIGNGRFSNNIYIEPPHVQYMYTERLEHQVWGPSWVTDQAVGRRRSLGSESTNPGGLPVSRRFIVSAMGKRAHDHGPLSPFIYVTRPARRAPPVAGPLPASLLGPHRLPGTPAAGVGLGTLPTGSCPPSSPAPCTARPALAPTVRPTARASSGAPSVALTESDRARIMETFMSDMRARSSIGPHASWLRTWVRLHERWWGQSVPPWPLSPDNIFVVAALMKDAGYRSFPNYVSAAKDTHIQMGYPWSHQLKLAVTRATASTQRGIGAAHQCQELPLAEALSVIHGPAPIVNQGPAQCGHVFIMGEFHVVRGIELISALASHLTVDEVALTETWHLPVSKTDAQAIGCSRTWGCTCGHAPACPYHTAAAHLHWLKATFGDAQGTMPPDLPLFPTITGKHTSAERLSSTVAAVADLLGKQLTDDMGDHPSPSMCSGYRAPVCWPEPVSLSSSSSSWHVGLRPSWTDTLAMPRSSGLRIPSAGCLTASTSPMCRSPSRLPTDL